MAYNNIGLQNNPSAPDPSTFGDDQMDWLLNLDDAKLGGMLRTFLETSGYGKLQDEFLFATADAFKEHIRLSNQI